MFRLHHHQEVAMPTMARALRQRKANLTDLLPERHVWRLATAHGRRFRQRTFTPVVTIYPFLRQVLHGNPPSANSVTSPASTSPTALTARPASACPSASFAACTKRS